MQKLAVSCLEGATVYGRIIGLILSQAECLDSAMYSGALITTVVKFCIKSLMKSPIEQQPIKSLTLYDYVSQ